MKFGLAKRNFSSARLFFRYLHSDDASRQLFSHSPVLQRNSSEKYFGYNKAQRPAV